MRWIKEEQCSDVMSQIIGYEKSQGRTGDVAFVDDKMGTQNNIHYVILNRPHVKSPHSAISFLMQTLHDQGKKIVLEKNTIFTNVEPTEMCKGMAKNLDVTLKVVLSKAANIPVKVSQWKPHYDYNNWAKRQELDHFKLNSFTSPGLDLTQESKGIEKHTGYHTIHRVYMMAAYALVTKRFSKSTLPTGQNIGAILVAKTGEILAWGVNTNADNRTLHAEVNMLQSYYKLNQEGYTGIPEGARIYTTLKPCAMCSGMISEAAAGSFKVFYGQTDKSSFATKTALDNKVGILQLLEQGMGNIKPILIKDPSLMYQNLKTMPDLLNYWYGVKQNKTITDDEARVTGFLAGELAIRHISNAKQQLDNKMKKYYSEEQKDPLLKNMNMNVCKALKHLSVFLNTVGLPAPWKG